MRTRDDETRSNSFLSKLSESLLGAVDVLGRYRMVLLSVLTLAVSTLGLTRPNCDSDVVLFGGYAHLLFTGQFGKVYADLANQAGPAELIWNGLVTAGAQSCPAIARTLPGGLLAALLLVFAAVASVRLVTRRADRLVVARLELFAGLTAAMTSSPWTLKWGHPADVIVPLCWIAAAGAARRHRWLAAGLLLGLSAGWESWAVLGVPVLLAGGLVRGVKSGAVASAVAAAWLLPFKLSGEFAMFDMSWDVWDTTLQGLVTHANFMTWGMRLVQLAVVLGAGLTLVWFCRGSRHLGWLLATTALVVRLITDPIFWPYYWVLTTVPATVGLASVVCGAVKGAARNWAVVGLLVLLAPHPPVPWAYPQLLASLACLVVAVCLGLGRESRPSGSASPGRAPASLAQ